MVTLEAPRTRSPDGVASGDAMCFGKNGSMSMKAAAVLQRRLNLRPDREEDHATFQRNLTIVEDFCELHPDAMRKTYKFDYYEREIYPLGMLCVFGAGEDLRQAVYDVHPEAAKHAFQMACGSAESMETIQWLYTRCTAAVRSDPYETGTLALHAVCQDSSKPEERMEIVKFLYELFPAAITRTDIYGYTPIHYACQYATSEIVEYLIEANPSAINKEINAGYTAFELSLWRRETCTEVVRYMLDKFPDLVKRVSPKTGRLPLHLACKYSPGEALVLVLEEYPEAAEVLDNDGKLPLYYAGGNEELDDSVLVLSVRAFPDAIDAIVNVEFLQKMAKQLARDAGPPKKKARRSSIEPAPMPIPEPEEEHVAAAPVAPASPIHAGAVTPEEPGTPPNAFAPVAAQRTSGTVIWN